MNEKQLSQIMDHLAGEMVEEKTDLWPTIHQHFNMGNELPKKGDSYMNTQQSSKKGLRVAAASLITLSILALLLIFTPQGKVWAQQVLQFFSRSTSDSLPQQSWQLTPVPTSETSTPDPASILDAKLTVSEVEQLSGFHVLQPNWIPEGFTFSGASFDSTRNITRVFYQSVDTNGFVLKQEPFQTTNECELCGEVGASAAVEEVAIGKEKGEYVVGVWQLTDSGAVWDNNPYLQTMRWQKDGMAFELMYMGSPEALQKADMISIAESSR